MKSPGGGAVGLLTGVNPQDNSSVGNSHPSSESSYSTTITPAGESEVRIIRLGEKLVSSNLITEAQLDQALEMQRDAGGRLGEVLVSLGALSEQSLANALAGFFGFEVANLRRDVVDPAVLTLVPEVVARETMSFPVRLEDHVQIGRGRASQTPYI